ncbi:DUF222 domain-containing protein [Microbacterium sp. A94]|uniref:HNH endonuclease signature motif containing protein n=1 Tax=Microbacterium sp. A94 TaxID=3450717 RepID=UPI003F430624
MTESTMTAPEQQVLLGDVVSTLITVERTIQQMNALRSSLLATADTIADHDEDITDLRSRELAHRAVAAEIGAAIRVSDRTIEAQMGDAALLRDNFPLTAAAFSRGEISAAHVRVITEAGAPIEDASQRAAYEKAVLARALEESPNRLRPYAKQLSERFRETSFADRHAEARKKRGVWTRTLEDGQSDLGISGSTAVIRGIFERLTQMAFAKKKENDRAAKEHAGDPDFTPDTRTLREIRADIAADLLLTGTPTGHDAGDSLLGAIQAFVEVTIPLLTLTDLNDTAPPAHLEGVGPIDPDTARILAGNAPGWDRVMTDPISGAVLAVDRYRPSEEMRRHLRARDRRCRFPGCRITARKTDDDHTVDHALGGATDIDNLSGKCRRHHVTKHHTPWKVKQLPGGVLEWTSPIGHVYVDRAPGVTGHVTFEDVALRVQGPVTPENPWHDGEGNAPF